MTLPKAADLSSFLRSHKPESLIIPGMVGFILLAIITAGFLIPKKNQETKEKRQDLSAYTKATTVKTAEGKTIGVPARVQLVSPEQLRSQLEAKKDITIIQIIEEDEWNDQHIEGTILFSKVDLKSPPNLDAKGNHVFVSIDGYESVLAVNSLLDFGFPWDKNFSLEGGLEAWKKKGYPLEN